MISKYSRIEAIESIKLIFLKPSDLAGCQCELTRKFQQANTLNVGSVGEHVNWLQTFQLVAALYILLFLNLNHSMIGNNLSILLMHRNR